MKQLQVWVTTEDDEATEEAVADELHSLALHADPFTMILSVDATQVALPVFGEELA